LVDKVFIWSRGRKWNNSFLIVGDEWLKTTYLFPFLPFLWFVFSLVRQSLFTRS
jgi:hypothetical protein